MMSRGFPSRKRKGTSTSSSFFGRIRLQLYYKTVASKVFAKIHRKIHVLESHSMYSSSNRDGENVQHFLFGLKGTNISF